MKSHVEGPHRWADALDVLKCLGEAFGDRHAAGLETDHDDLVETVVALNHLMSHPTDGPAHVIGGHDPRVGHKNAPKRGRLAAFSFGHRPRLLVRPGLTGPASRSSGQPTRA